MNLDGFLEPLARNVWLGRIWAMLIVMSFGAPWVYPEDYGHAVSLYKLLVITGSDFSRMGDYVGVLASLAVLGSGAWYLYAKLSDNGSALFAALVLVAGVLFSAVSVLVFDSVDRLDWGWFCTLALCVPHPLYFLATCFEGGSPSSGSGLLSRVRKPSVTP